MPQKVKRSASENQPIPVEMIERRIFLIRGHKVMLDSDLAELYDVPTKALNQAVRRNLDRFPEDFRVPPRRRRGDSMEPATICDRFPETP